MTHSIEFLKKARDLVATHYGNVTWSLYRVHNDGKIEHHNGEYWEHRGSAEYYQVTKIDYSPLNGD